MGRIDTGDLTTEAALRSEIATPGGAFSDCRGSRRSKIANVHTASACPEAGLFRFSMLQSVGIVDPIVVPDGLLPGG